MEKNRKTDPFRTSATLRSRWLSVGGYFSDALDILITSAILKSPSVRRKRFLQITRASIRVVLQLGGKMTFCFQTDAFPYFLHE